MLTITRRIGESVKVGDYRIVFRAKKYNAAELSIFYQNTLQVKQLSFDHTLIINDDITISARPHFMGYRASSPQVDFLIQAPLSIKIQRDELEAGIKKRRKNNYFFNVMS